ncbi:uncharacterized protein LOC127122768 [Lathyrus oleraceus]|uniref:uncharacterized protein LOC127122768 n=1 Tax=Pisum sativum TaxID=3888 RepID=UPI0021D2CFFF|nr:uncharacterized protein LOC127122768 [Pisum sativum]
MTAKNVTTLEPSTTINKPHSMTSLYLDPISVEPNVCVSKDDPVMPNVLEDVEASETSNRPRFFTTLSKSNMIVTDKDDVDKNICVLISQALCIEPKTNVLPDVSTSLAQPDNTTKTPLNKSDKTPLNKSDVNVSTLSPEKLKDKEASEGMTGDLAEKDENSIEKKDQSTFIVNVEDLESDDVPIGQILVLGMAKRLKIRKGQAIESSSMLSKSLRKRASVGPTKIWSKHIVSTSRKQSSGKKIPANILEVPIDNILFHSVENVEKWKFVYQRRLVLEREMGKNGFECKEVMSLIQEAGLIKTITGFGKECDNKRSKEFRKVYVRGRCVDFSPETINRFFDINEEEQVEVEVSDNVIYKVITAKQVKEWLRKGKLSASALSVKYVVLHRIGVANWILTNHTSNIGIGLDTCKTLDETIRICTKRKSKIEMLKDDGTSEEEENEEGFDASDDGDTTNSDEDRSIMVLLCVGCSSVFFGLCPAFFCTLKYSWLCLVCKLSFD